MGYSSHLTSWQGTEQLGSSKYHENCKNSKNFSIVPIITPKMKVLSIIAKNI